MVRTPKLGGDPDEDEDDERDPDTGMYKVRLLHVSSTCFFVLLCPLIVFFFSAAKRMVYGWFIFSNLNKFGCLEKCKSFKPNFLLQGSFRIYELPTDGSDEPDLIYGSVPTAGPIKIFVRLYALQALYLACPSRVKEKTVSLVPCPS